MEVNNENAFYTAATNHMVAQLNYLAELIGRDLTLDERDNIYEFYINLPENVRTDFEDQFGPLL